MRIVVLAGWHIRSCRKSIIMVAPAENRDLYPADSHRQLALSDESSSHFARSL